MPGFTTHYVLGVKAYHDLDAGPLKEIILRQRQPFQLGLQGPDIFFYNIPMLRYRDNRNVGTYMHEHHVRDFFTVILDEIASMDPGTEREAATAYLCGYMCHYCGDTICHPYVYARISFDPGHPDMDSYSRHAALENDLDALVLWRYLKKKPSEFNQAATIALNGRQKQFIGLFLADCINFAYYPINEFNNFEVSPSLISRTILATRIGCRTLEDKHDRKQRGASIFEKLFLKTPVVSSKLVGDTIQDERLALNTDHETWCNPWNKALASQDSFPQLWDRTVGKCNTVLELLNDLTIAGAEGSPHERERLLSELGNNSLHSGLPIRD